MDDDVCDEEDTCGYDDDDDDDEEVEDKERCWLLLFRDNLTKWPRIEPYFVCMVRGDNVTDSVAIFCDDDSLRLLFPYWWAIVSIRIDCCCGDEDDELNALAE